jgi:hypothetical protein
MSSPEIHSPDLLSYNLDSKEVIKLAKESLDVFAGLAIPEVYVFAFPPIFLAIWQLLCEKAVLARDFSKLAVGIPRGFGKTSLLKLFILWCILFSSKKFILVVSATEGKAVDILSDIVDSLEEENIKSLFGDWKLAVSKNTQNTKVFAFRGRSIILMAIGVGGDLRGRNIKNSRPDIILFDDIQSKEDAESEVVSKSIETWMLSTAMKSKHYSGCLFIFLANMYPTPHSILRKLKHNSSWIKVIVGGILASGKSLWEEQQPIKQLLEEYQADINAGHPEIFHAEVMNDENVTRNNRIDIAKIPEYPPEFHSEAVFGKFIIIDPATSKANSDGVSIGYFQVIDCKPVLRKLIEGVFSSRETCEKALSLALEEGCPLIAIESNAYQYELKVRFDEIIQDFGMQGITAVDIYSGSSSKNTRIVRMFPALLTGDIHIHPECRPAVFHQIVEFDPLKSNNTDGILDLLVYAPRVMQEYGDYIQGWIDTEISELGSIRVFDELEGSCF